MDRKKRHRSREIALQALYQIELARRGTSADAGPDDSDIEGFVRESTEDPTVRGHALRLVDGTLSILGLLDRKIEAVTDHWKPERIAPVDRSILRLALYELLEEEDVPPRVSINEAIELAKRFSTAQSGAFVNGILDRLYRDLQGPSTAPPAGDEATAAPPPPPPGSQPE